MLRSLLVGGLVIANMAFPVLARAGTVAIFYYPWYGTPAHDGTWQHWNQNSHWPPNDIYSSFYPATGPYSSSDQALLSQQMAEISATGIDEVVISWWGRGSAEDKRLPAVLAAARRYRLKPAIHLEPYLGRTAITVTEDLAYFASLRIRDVYVYHPRDFAATDWAAVRAQAPSSLRLFAETDLIGFAAAGKFEGFYTYDFIGDGGKFIRLCHQAHAAHILCAPSVGPGYDSIRAGEAPAMNERRNGQTYDNLWTAAIAAKPDMVTVTSFNEWGEGTQIEPAAAHHGYRSYDGAWGLFGKAAQTAYLTRTAYWTGRFHSGR